MRPASASPGPARPGAQGLALILALAKPRVLALMCTLALGGAVTAPGFLSPDFRPPPVAGAAPFRLLAAAFPRAFTPPLWSLALALGAGLVVALMWAGTAMANDLADVAIDRLVNRSRPLAAGTLAPGRALAWALALQGLALALSLLGGDHRATLLVAGGLLLGNAYSVPPLRLRRSGLAANAVIGAGCCLAVLGGALALGAAGARVLALAAGLGLLAAACSMVKDFKDMAGDGATGVRTLPVILGPGPAARVTAAAVAAAYALSGGLLLLTGAGPGYLGAHALLGAANLAVAIRAAVRPQWAYRSALLLYMGVTVVHVLAQRP